MNTTTCYECSGEISPLAKACASCGAPLPFGPQLPANFHVARQGKRFGPYTEFAARNYLAEGSIRPDDLCWQPGLDTWLPVSNVLKPRPAIEAPQPTYEAQPSYAARPAQLAGEQRAARQPQPRQTKLPSLENLRVMIGRSMWGYDDLSDAEKKDLLSHPEYANHPQPIDFGLTRDDVDLHTAQRWYRVGDNVRYKEGRRWFGRFAAVIAHHRKHSCPGFLAFEQALRLHRLYEVAVYEAEQERQKLKRSYWIFLDGYAFEKATAEVLNKQQFHARLTPGSGDGGVDIEVTRNGLRGVVQCKAHVKTVGPHVVRDLYGVMHHSGADFGIIVSRGGFTRGAVEFARDKPILFVDVDELIAMQEGKDVLREAFTSK